MIIATIISFHPCQPSLQKLVDALAEQVDHIVIVDNTPNNAITIEQATVLHQGKNTGIAAAQNRGIEWALSQGAEFVFMLDQDSHIPAGLVQELMQGYTFALSHQHKLACISPRPHCVFTDTLIKPKIQKNTFERDALSVVKQVIASGMLIPKNVLEEIGYKESALFIDGVDHEWCWRAAKHGYEIAIWERAIMPHKLGDSRGSVLGLSYKVGSPERLYYQFRNILILSRRGYVPTYWKLRNGLAIPVRFCIMLLLEAPRLTRAKYMLKGIWHGLRGKLSS